MHPRRGRHGPVVGPRQFVGGLVRLLADQAMEHGWPVVFLLDGGGHRNLLTSALSAAEWETVSTAVYNQPMLVKNAIGYYTAGPRQAVNPQRAEQLMEEEAKALRMESLRKSARLAPQAA